MAFVFHVEFGMNDTPLTQALEKGNYASAERLILDCPNSSYLDDGCYQRTPLYICLCGVDQYHQRVATRNLYLARLLIERGASVNKRVPVTNFGSEYISPGKSSLELLVDFYIELTREPGTESRNCLWRPWNPMTELVVGLNKQYLTRSEDVKEDVLDLIFNILRHGGDANILDEHRRTLLHRAARQCPDVSVLRLLHSNGGSLTQLDATGNCPLLALCSVERDSDDEDEGWEQSSASSVESSGAAWHREQDDAERRLKTRLQIPRETLLYLTKAKEINVNHQNNLGHSALFHAIVREDISSARQLLELGANPSLQANVWKSRRKKRKISPLFASLMSIPLQHSVHNSSLYNRMIQPVQPISTLVDAGYFTTDEVVGELSKLIAADFPEFSHLCPMADSLVHLMFGYKTASLKQLAARRVFQCCLLESTSCLHTILPVSAITESYPSASAMELSPDSPSDVGTVTQESSLLPATASRSLPTVSPTNSFKTSTLFASSSSSSSHAQHLPLAQLLASNPGKLEEYLTLVLNGTVLRCLTQILQLPSSLQLSLEAHLLYLRMLLKVSPLTASRPALPPVVSLGGAVGIGMRGGEIARFVPGGGIFRIGENVSDNEDDVDDDEDDSSDASYNSSSEDNVEGDSDLEYW